MLGGGQKEEVSLEMDNPSLVMKEAICQNIFKLTITGEETAAS